MGFWGMDLGVSLTAISLAVGALWSVYQLAFGRRRRDR